MQNDENNQTLSKLMVMPMLVIAGFSFLASLIAGLLVGRDHLAAGIQTQTLVCVVHLGCLQFAAMWTALAKGSYFRHTFESLLWLGVVLGLSYLGRYAGQAYYGLSGFEYLLNVPIKFETVINIPSWVVAQMPFWFFRLGLGWRIVANDDPASENKTNFYEAAFFILLACVSVWLIGSRFDIRSLDAFTESSRSFLVAAFLVAFSFVTICWPMVYHGLKPSSNRRTVMLLVFYVVGLLGLLIIINSISKQEFSLSDSVVGTIIPIGSLACVYGLLISRLRARGRQLTTRRLRKRITEPSVL